MDFGGRKTPHLGEKIKKGDKENKEPNFHCEHTHRRKRVLT